MNKITIIAAILMCSTVAAQEFTHELSVNIGGGVSSFQTQPSQGDNLMQLTGTVGLGYHFFFNPQWGIGSGVNFAAYKGGIIINNYEDKQTSVNTETGHTFDFLVSSSIYKETQQTTMIIIPLMAQYQTEGETAFYVSLGFKTGIPFLAKSQSKGAYTTKGYYQNLNVTYEDLPDYGFVTNQPFPGNKTGIRVKPVLIASTELGIKCRLDESTSLYIGIYADCGLTNMSKKGNKDNHNLVVYQFSSPAQLEYNTAAGSYAKKLTPFAVGINLRFAYGRETLRRATPTANETQVW